MNKIACVALVFIGLSIQAVSQSKDTTTWTVLLGGDRAGFLKKWKNADNTLTEWFQWNDRGRGDSTLTTYTYNNQGYITSIQATGVDYYKKPITEEFSNSHGVAQWKNASEKEERKIDYPAEYVPISIAAGTRFDNYFNASDYTIKLLPSGESKLTVLKEHILKDGKRIRLVSTIGSGLTPGYAWIDERNEFFAAPGDWMGILPQGYESYNEELTQLQDEFKNTYYKDLSKKLTQTQAGIVIKNASLFNSKTGTVQKNTTIIIENGIVKEITTKNNVTVPASYKLIDASGKFVMPGLWDNHVHYGGDADGLMDIGTGVTNVRDMGSPLSLLDRKKQIDEGSVIGPRIQAMCGFIDGEGPYALSIGSKVDSVEEGKAAVRKYASLGYQQVKLYSSLKPELVKPLAQEAKSLGLRVSGHIPAHMLASEAVQDGYNEIQHINMVFLNFYGKELDTRTPLRFSTVAERAGSFDFESVEFKSFISLLKQNKTIIDPTVSFFEDMFTGKVGVVRPTTALFANRFPVSVQRSFKSGTSLEVPAAMEEAYKRSFQNMLKMVKALYDNQVTIIPGTDDLVGFVLHKELENYVKAGIPNNEVLKMATWTSAEVNRKSDLYGSVEVNRPADIIIIDGNPLVNIQDTQRVETVIKNTSIYQTKTILEAVSIKSYQ